MGETSAKSLRSGGMEDVIFAGTASRPPRDFAEVVLGGTDFEGEELEVVRRIERGAGSAGRARSMDYLLPLTDDGGRELVLRGHKDVRRGRGVGPWGATTVLATTLEADGEQLGGAGALTISPLGALRLVASARATGLPPGGRAATAARAVAVLLRFGGFFAGAVLDAFRP